MSHEWLSCLRIPRIARGCLSCRLGARGVCEAARCGLNHAAQGKNRASMLRFFRGRTPSATSVPFNTKLGFSQQIEFAVSSSIRSTTRSYARPISGRRDFGPWASVARKCTNPSSNIRSANCWLSGPNVPIRLPAVTCIKQPRSTRGSSRLGSCNSPWFRSGCERIPTIPIFPRLSSTPSRGK